MRYTMTEQKKQELVADLLGIEDGELISVLEAVFQSKDPFKYEGNYSKRHYFLGIATSDIFHEFYVEGLTAEGLTPEEPWTEERWQEWEIMAVAYPDPTEYAPDVDISGTCIGEYGQCHQCKTELASTLKRTVCPICGGKSYLT